VLLRKTTVIMIKINVTVPTVRFRIQSKHEIHDLQRKNDPKLNVN
jgi:hypothetical protein